MEPSPIKEAIPEIASTEPALTSTTHTTTGRSLLIIIAIVVALVCIGIAYLFTQGYFVAATVNGSPISRLAVIRDLEKQGGKQALAAMIEKKLIDTELAKKGVTLTAEEIDAKIKEIESQVEAQGGTLLDALTAQGMTMDQLRTQLETQLKLEKHLSSGISVTEEEILTFMEENKVTPPKGADLEAIKQQIGEQLKQTKTQQEIQAWIAGLQASSTIKYYKTY